MAGDATAAEAGRLRSVAKTRAEMIFDIDGSLVERFFDGSYIWRKVCW